MYAFIVARELQSQDCINTTDSFYAPCLYYTYKIFSELIIIQWITMRPFKWRHAIHSILSVKNRGGPIVVGIAYNAYPQNILCLKCLPTNFEILLHIKPKKIKIVNFLDLKFALFYYEWIVPTHREKVRPPSASTYRGHSNLVTLSTAQPGWIRSEMHQSWRCVASRSCVSYT